jgi:hypothetical protein
MLSQKGPAADQDLLASVGHSDPSSWRVGEFIWIGFGDSEFLGPRNNRFCQGMFGLALGRETRILFGRALVLRRPETVSARNLV